MPVLYSVFVLDLRIIRWETKGKEKLHHEERGWKGDQQCEEDRSITGPIGAGVGEARVSITFSGVTRGIVQRGGKPTWRMLASRAVPRSSLSTRFPADSLNVGWHPSLCEQAIPLSLHAGINTMVVFPPLTSVVVKNHSIM